MLLIGSICIGIGLFLIIGCLLKRVELDKRGWCIFALVMIFGLAILAFWITPPEAWDLSRHYDLLAEMEHKGWAFVFNESPYAYLPVINLLYALIAMSGVYHILPSTVVVICYLILLFFFVEVGRKQQIDSRFIAAAIVINLALCPYFHMVSGIRNVLAFTLCAAVFYMDIYLRKNKILIILLYGTAVLVHPSSLLIVGIRVIMPILLHWKWLNVFLVFWSMMVEIIVKVLVLLPIPFFESVGWKLNDYITGQTFSGHKILCVKYIFLIFTLGAIEYIKKCVKDKVDYDLMRYINSFEIVILTIIGAFRVEFIADRLCFFIAFACIPVMAFIYFYSIKKVKWSYFLMVTVCCTLIFVHQVLYFGNDLIR
ncbi:MAG: hypothetical protein EOM11_05845 [Erysipelotrichia bacterium]|nr:hypothetical protein [Erysipelotrichia bacterium]